MDVSFRTAGPAIVNPIKRVGQRPSGARPATWIGLCWLIAVALPAVAREPGKPGARVPWTTSRFSGTPEPPLPYVAELAFPKLQFDRPVLIAEGPGTGRLFVGEVAGKVRSFPERANADRADLAIDLARTKKGFAALYGLAFHPRFAENGYVFLCYVHHNDKPDGTRVARFTFRKGEPPTIDPESEKLILTYPSGGHNGGCLTFGRDGMLYISTGDSASPSPPDPLRTGQNLEDLLSSILRVDVDHEANGLGYAIPPDNPFLHFPHARPEIWAYGFRNPWRMSVDRQTGELWVGDVGWELWEMIDRVERGGNYGWSIREGNQPIYADGARGPTPILPPTIEHSHSEAASITGGYVYRGTRLSALAGVYIYGDYQSGKIWGARTTGSQVTWRGELADTGLRIVSFGEGEGGELYLVEHERSNQIYRLIPNPAPRSAGRFPRALSETGLFQRTAGLEPAPGVVTYPINAQAWADGAAATRMLAIPGNGRIRVVEGTRWELPEGSVLAKTVSLDVVAGNPSSRRRVETQVLHFEEGSWRPYSYAWNDEQTDALLVDAAGASRSFTVRDADAPGGRRDFPYRFAARSECTLCHNPWVQAQATVFGRQSASPLAFDAGQLDCVDRRGASEVNALEELERLGLFGEQPPVRPRYRLVDPYNTTANLEARARSYLQVNCAHCHQAHAGGSANIALTVATPLRQTKTIDAFPIQGTFGLPEARIIAPGRPNHSVLYYRIAKTGAGRMPRIGSQRVDERALALFADWIDKLPGADPAAATALKQSLANLADPVKDAAERRREIASRTQTTEEALDLIQAAARGNISPSVIREAAAIAKDSPKGEVRDLFERFLADSERVKRLGDTIDPEAILAIAGDAERGRRWFVSESVTSCKTCHRLGGVGTELGPDLANIGTKHTPRELLRQILEPSRDIDPKFATQAVETRGGLIHTGLLVSKTNDQIVLRDAKGQEIRIPASDVEHHSTERVSMMPEGLLRDLTAQQAADLVAYLASLKTR